jgi:hypothetical protein
VHQAAALEGIMCGPSAGAALKVAIEVASRPEAKGKTIVVILASHGIRYTAHPLWADVKKEAVANLPAVRGAGSSNPPHPTSTRRVCLEETRTAELAATVPIAQPPNTDKDIALVQAQMSG